MTDKNISGDLTVTIDTDDLVTESALEEALAGVEGGGVPDDLVTESALEEALSEVEGGEVPDDLVTEGQLESALSDVEEPALPEDVVTEDELESALAGLGGGGDVDAGDVQAAVEAALEDMGLGELVEKGHGSLDRLAREMQHTVGLDADVIRASDGYHNNEGWGSYLVAEESMRVVGVDAVNPREAGAVNFELLDAEDGYETVAEKRVEFDDDEPVGVDFGFEVPGGRYLLTRDWNDPAQDTPLHMAREDYTGQFAGDQAGFVTIEESGHPEFGNEEYWYYFGDLRLEPVVEDD